MNTIMRRKRFVLLLAVVFIAGFFVMKMPAVCYGDAAVDIPESNPSSSSKDDSGSSSSSDNNTASNNTAPSESSDSSDSSSSNNNSSSPAQNNNYNNDYTPPAQSNNYNNGSTSTGQNYNENYNYTAPEASNNAEPTNITAVNYYVRVKLAGSTADGDNAGGADSSGNESDADSTSSGGSVSGLNFRSNAGTGFDTVEDIVIPNGTVLHIKKEATDGNGERWGYTEYKGKKGWIYLGLTKKVKKPKKKGKKADYYVIVKTLGRGMYIRSGPGDQYDKLQRRIIPKGTVLHITKTAKATNGENWGYTKYNNMNGWVDLKKTEVTTASEKKAASASSDSDASANQNSDNTNSDMYFMMNILIMLIIGLVILALIIIIVVLLTRRNDRR